VQDDIALRIHKGMAVEDADGDKVGTIDAIYLPVTVTSQPTSAAEPVGEAYLKVHSGLPIIGTTYYIPMGAVRDVADERVILKMDETRLEMRGWHERPAWIDE
jgi:hypothetical protein